MVYVLCALAALIGFVGAWALRRESFFWAGALLIGALAAASYAGATAGSGAAFRVYYALGASMFPGWVGVGSLYLVLGRKTARWAALFVLALSAIQLGLTLPADVNGTAFAALNGSNGEGILVRGSWVAPTVLFNTLGLGFAAVAAFLAWWRAFRVQQSRTAAAAIGLSVVVIGVLARSAAVYRMLADAGAPQAFMLLDAVAFALVWAGAALTRELPRPLERLLMGAAGRSLATND
ncbi:MAG: hypothetical protein ACHQ7M_12565 [Chloroflexota bacterium]